MNHHRNRPARLGGPVLAALATVLGLAACGSPAAPSQSQLTACRTAMVREYRAAQQSGQQQYEPSQCKGIPAGTLQRFAGDILASSPASPTLSPAPTGKAAFITAVQSAGLGNRDVTDAPAILAAGRRLCNAAPCAVTLTGSASAAYSYLVSLLEEETGATQHQAEVFTDSALWDLCPGTAYMVPAGAPGAPGSAS